MQITNLKTYNLTSELCNQTLYHIMYENKKILKFKPGELVLKCHPRSPLSKEGRKLYDKEYGSEIKEEVNKTLS